MKVKDDPKNWMLTNGAIDVRRVPPAVSAWRDEAMFSSDQPVWAVYNQRTEDQHPQEVCAAATEGALLQRAAIFDQEEHMEDKVETCEGRGPDLGLKSTGHAASVSGEGILRLPK